MNEVMTYRDKVNGNSPSIEGEYKLIPETKDNKRIRYDAVDICRKDGSIRQICYSDIHDREFNARGTELVLITAFGKFVICRGRNLQELTHSLRNCRLPRLHIYDASCYSAADLLDDDPVITDIEEMAKFNEK